MEWRDQRSKLDLWRILIRTEFKLKSEFSNENVLTLWVKATEYDNSVKTEKLAGLLLTARYYGYSLAMQNLANAKALALWPN